MNQEYIHVVYRESHGDHIALTAYYDFRSACNEVLGKFNKFIKDPNNCSNK